MDTAQNTSVAKLAQCTTSAPCVTGGLVAGFPESSLGRFICGSPGSLHLSCTNRPIHVYKLIFIYFALT